MQPTVSTILWPRFEYHADAPSVVIKANVGDGYILCVGTASLAPRKDPVDGFGNRDSYKDALFSPEIRWLEKSCHL